MLRTITNIEQLEDNDIVVIKESKVKNICDADLQINWQLAEVPNNVWAIIDARYEGIKEDKK